MTEKRYKIYLNDFQRIIVYIKVEDGNILNFVVKLEYYYNNQWLEVERYDCFHGCVHKDILNLKGEKIKTIKFPLVDNKAGLNIAIKDFKENNTFIIWRFINEKR